MVGLEALVLSELLSASSGVTRNVSPLGVVKSKLASFELGKASPLGVIQIPVYRTIEYRNLRNMIFSETVDMHAFLIDFQSFNSIFPVI